MRIRISAKNWILWLGIALGAVLYHQSVYAALCSRVLTFSDGSVLTASQLNSEFNNNVDCVNSISDANIVSGAAILPIKLSATIAGDGLARNSTTGVLSVGVDGSTIEITSDTLNVKDLGITAAKLKSDASTDANRAVTTDHIRDSAITTAKINASAVTTAKIADSNVTTAKIADSNVTTAKIADSNVTTAKIAAQNVTIAKMESKSVGSSVSAGGMALSSSSGSFSTTSAGFTAVTNHSVTVVTTGRPVHVMLVSDGGGGASVVSVSDTNTPCEGVIQRDGAEVARFGWQADSSSLEIPAGAINFMDMTPSAASHTYTFVVRRVSGVGTLFVLNAKLLAYEI